MEDGKETITSTPMNVR